MTGGVEGERPRQGRNCALLFTVSLSRRHGKPLGLVGEIGGDGEEEKGAGGEEGEGGEGDYQGGGLRMSSRRRYLPIPLEHGASEMKRLLRTKLR